MHPVADDPIAAPIDPGIPHRSFTEKDFEGESKNKNTIQISSISPSRPRAPLLPNQIKVSICTIETLAPRPFIINSHDLLIRFIIVSIGCYKYCDQLQCVFFLC